MFTQARKKRERPSWIGEGVWKELQRQWGSEEYVRKWDINKRNRTTEAVQQQCTLEARCLIPSTSGSWVRKSAESPHMWSCISAPLTKRAKGCGSPRTPTTFIFE